jgi:uncharacterized protein YbjT (DUF2867 family)
VILVAGASGNVGAAIVHDLAAAGQGVRALVRPGSGARVAAGAERAEADLNDRTSLRATFDGVDAAFLLAGYPDMPGVLADLADAGTRHVVLLSTGAVVGGDLDNAVVRFNVVAESAVRDCGLPWSVLRPSGFMSNTLQWVPQLRDGNQVLEPFADVPISVIDPADIAAVAVLALTTDGHESRSYRLTGPAAMLPADRARILGEVLGRPIELTPESDAAAHQRLATAMPEPMVDAFLQFFRRGGYDDSHVSDVAPRLLGRALHTFRDWAEANADAFR